MPTSLSEFFKQSPTWLVSLTVHLGVLLVLLMIPMAHHVKSGAQDFIAYMEDQASEHEMDASHVDQVGTFNEQGNYSATEITGSTSGAAVASSTSQGAHVVQEAVDQAAGGDPEISIGGDSDLLAFTTGEEMLGEVTRSGGSVENTPGGTAGAIDRLTQELQASLRQSRTLVMWAFDATPSLKERRNLIADRFENVYRQLDALEATKTNGLSTVVASYADKFNLLTKDPVTDVRQVITKVRGIQNVETGSENTFSAVKQLATLFQRYRKVGDGQKLMMIIVTDEKGSDDQTVDETILMCRKYGIRVFVVGNSTLFGRAETYIKWKYEDGFEEELPMDGGPETVEPELLALGFWGAGNDMSLTRMSSGYGPYALTRLCRETGGMYFVAESNSQRSFDPSVMRNYQPDYRPAKEYMLAKQKSPAKIALVEAAKASKTETINIPPEIFRADNDGALKEAITEAQKPAAVLAFQLNKLYPILQAGEKDREKLKEPRWRAGYDLAMGRVLAMKVRFEGYNKMLAEMKSTPQTFKKKESNQWRIVASKDILAGADIKKMEKQASAYLKRVIDEHPDTPWATLAAKELGTPMGWQWKEEVGNYPKENPNESPEQKRIRLAKDEERRREMAKNAPPPRKKPVL